MSLALFYMRRTYILSDTPKINNFQGRVSYLQNGAQFGERFQVVDVNDERSQQIVEGEAERLQEGVEKGRFHREEIEEELIFVLTHMDEKGTAGTHQRTMIARVFHRQETNRF